MFLATKRRLRLKAPTASALAGRHVAMLFEKPSLRTRLTFELAIKQLGGDSVAHAGLIGEREPVKDVARNLDRWTQCIVARVFSHYPVLPAPTYFARGRIMNPAMRCSSTCATQPALRASASTPPAL